MEIIGLGALIWLIGWTLKRKSKRGQNYAEGIFLGERYEKVDPVLDLARKYGITTEQETEQ